MDEELIFFNSELTSEDIEEILTGVSEVVGIIKRNADGTFEAVTVPESAGDLFAVSYNATQTISDSQKLIARSNIDASIKNIFGSAPPTTSTVGVVGQLYLETTTKKIYRCDSVSGSTYTWNAYGGSGGDVDGKIDKSAQATKTLAMTSPVGIDSNGKLWSVPGSGGGGSDTFIATYGVTTLEEIQTAYSSGKNVVAVYSEQDQSGETSVDYMAGLVMINESAAVFSTLVSITAYDVLDSGNDANMTESFEISCDETEWHKCFRNISKNNLVTKESFMGELEEKILDMLFADSTFTFKIDNDPSAADQIMYKRRPLVGTTSEGYIFSSVVDKSGKLINDAYIYTTGETNEWVHRAMEIQTVPTLHELSNPQSIAVADRNEYEVTNASSVSITYPTGRFEVWMRITTASSGSISITLPSDSSYIGSAPAFGNSETWEISIKDKVVVAAKVGT